MMKSSFRLILAALAATAALISCTKEPTPGQTDQTPAAPATEGTRVITVSFGPQTKTALGSDGLTPNFTKDDKILLITVPETQGAKVDTQTVTVSVDPKTGDATVTTKLSGNLKALYPARMAEEVEENFNILVPAEQSGKFEDANICQAEISSDSKAAVFTNMYALFKIKSPDDSQNLTVKSLPTIGEDGQRSGDRQPINDDAGYTVTVPSRIFDMPDSIYYVALNPGVKLSDLSFEVEFWDEGTGSIKGIPTSKIKAQADNLQKGYDQYNAVATGTAYTIDDSNWHEYVEIGGRKWATMNIGAESPADYGYYLAWGATEVAYDNLSENAFIFKTNKPSSYVYSNEYDGWNCNNGFADCNTPYFDGDGYTNSKYNKDEGKKVLDLDDDAANVNWGGAWRMPTGTTADFTALIKACKVGYSSGSIEPEKVTFVPEDRGVYYYDVVGSKGLYFVDENGNKLFLPAAGYGNGGGDSLKWAGSSGYYWSSTLSQKSIADFLSITSSKVEPACSDRHRGGTIRPVSD